MPNGYAVVPNILPGNVTIGGNLIVGGDQVTIGAAAQKVRIGKAAVGQGNFSYNLGFDSATVDSGGNSAFALQLPSSGAQPQLRVVNTAGNTNVAALPETVFSDYTAHAHTGTTTEDTIYSKTIRGGVMGANGALRAMLLFNSGAQGGTNTTIRFKVGATVLASYTFNVATSQFVEFFFGNRNAQNVNIGVVQATTVGGGAINGSYNAAIAVDTSADMAITVTVQSGVVGDAQSFDTVVMTLENSFGPV